MENKIITKTKEINGITYTAFISNDEVKGITFKSPNFIGKRIITKYVNSYTTTKTARFYSIAKHFEEA